MKTNIEKLLRLAGDYHSFCTVSDASANAEELDESDLDFIAAAGISLQELEGLAQSSDPFDSGDFFTKRS